MIPELNYMAQETFSSFDVAKIVHLNDKVRRLNEKNEKRL